MDKGTVLRGSRFENIDRFDDLYIFEAPRELNTILDNCKGSSGRGGHIS
jgi:hypothetical protein